MDSLVRNSLSSWQIAWLIIITLTTITVVIKFDINRYLENRRNIAKQRSMNACRHMVLETDGNKLVCKILFVPPSGTMKYQCQRCGLIVSHFDKSEYDKLVEYYISNPKKYKKHNKRFEKLLKKSGHL